MQRSPENANRAQFSGSQQMHGSLQRSQKMLWRTVNDPPAALSSAEGPAAGFDEALPP